MPKANGPLFSLAAHGQIAKELIYFDRGNGPRVRRFHEPHVAATPKQIGHRQLVRLAVARWQTMSALEKMPYNTAAEGLAKSGFNLFIAEACANPPAVLGLIGYWPCEEYVANKIKDLSGRGYDLYKKYAFYTFPTLETSLSAKFGKCLHGAVDAQCLQVPKDFVKDYSSGVFTCLMWVKIIDTDGGFIGWPCAASGAGYEGWMIYLIGSPAYWYLMATVPGSHKEANLGRKNASAWAMVGVSREADGKWYFIFNNTRVYSGMTLAGDYYNALSDCGIFIAWNYCQGYADDLKYYNRVLGAAELAKLYSYGHK